MRAVHRVLSISVVLFTFFLATTGILIQSIDLQSFLTRAPASNLNVMAMRERLYGPNSYMVIATADYDVEALPDGANLASLLDKILRSAHAALGPGPFRFVELRMAGGRPVGQVRPADPALPIDAVRGGYIGDAPVYRFDALTGAALGKFSLPDHAAEEKKLAGAPRNTIRFLHRMTAFGEWALWINVFISIALGVLIVTGAVMYVKIFRARVRLKRRNLFWVAGGWWKTLHRGVSMVAAVLLAVMTLSGAVLAIDIRMFAFDLAAQRDGERPPLPDPSSPLDDAALPGMLRATMDAYRKAAPGGAVRVVHLRDYAGMPQGVVISDGAEAGQFVFDTRSQAQVTDSEAGYPTNGFPISWHVHQIAKTVHRGDFFGITGRLMNLLAGLSLLYLSISGAVMYYEMYQKRRRAGRKSLFWK